MNSATSKLTETLSLSYKALYTIYSDAFNDSRSRLARAARATVRSVYFDMSRKRVIPHVRLDKWLPLMVSKMGEAPGGVTLPIGLFENEDVGSLAYFYVLARICSLIKPGQIVEFGTFLGAGTLVMALNCEAEILTLDLPDEVSENDVDTLNAADQSLVVNRRCRTGAFYKSHHVKTRIKELRCDSRMVKLDKHVGSVDLCLVDGGHSLECVQADTQNALSVLAPGGLILWDDYFWLYPDVVSYLEDFSKTHAGVVCIENTGLVAWQSPQ